jgi:hypothetical protein
MTKQEAIAKIQAKIATAEEETKKLDVYLSMKVKSMKLDPDTPEHRALITKGVKARWMDAKNRYVTSLQNTIDNLGNHDDFEKVVAGTPTLISAEKYVEKSAASYIPDVSAKYKYYVEEKGKLSLNVLKERPKHKPTKAVAAHVDALFAKIENMVINGTKFNDFKAAVDSDMKQVASSIETIKELVKLKKNLQNTIEKTVHLERNGKTSIKEVKEAIAELATLVNENKKNIELIDLAGVQKALEDLDAKFGDMDKNVSETLKKFKTETTKLVNRKIKEALKGKVDESTLAAHMESVEQILQGFEDRLNAMDLATLIAKFEELTVSYNNVYSRIDETVKVQIEEMKKSIKNSIAISVGKKLSEKLKDFDKKHKADIIKEAIEEFKKIGKETVGEMLTDDEVLDRVIDTINEKYKIARK